MTDPAGERQLIGNPEQFDPAVEAEPDHSCADCKGWAPEGTLHRLEARRGHVSVFEATDEPMTPDAARRLGAALIAAARAAEEL